MKSWVKFNPPPPKKTTLEKPSLIRVKIIIESSHRHLNTDKISLVFNEPLKSYHSLYFATLSMKSISHTFASFGTT